MGLYPLRSLNAWAISTIIRLRPKNFPTFGNVARLSGQKDGKRNIGNGMKERNLRRTEATETDTLKTKRVKIPRAKSHLEEAFWLQLRVENLQGEFKREFRF